MVKQGVKHDKIEKECVKTKMISPFTIVVDSNI